MIAAALLYAAVLGVLLAGAAWVAEFAVARGGSLARGGRRWLWAAALAGSAAAPLWTLTVARVHPAAAPAGGAMLDLRTLDVGQAADARRAAGAGAGWTDRVRAALAVAPATFAVPALWSALDQYLLVVWAGATLALLVRYGASMRRTRHLVRTWPTRRLSLSDPDAFDGNAGEGIAVCVAPDVGPAVVGVLRPALVVPRWAFDDPRLPLIVAHERAHVRAGDPLLRTAAVVAASLVPWSPAAWWQLARLDAAVEIDCDARVLRGVARSPTSARARALVRTYGGLLLDVAARVADHGTHSLAGTGTGLALDTPPTVLDRRIQAMTTRTTRRARAHLLVGSAAALALVTAAIAVPRPVAARPTPRLAARAAASPILVAENTRRAVGEPAVSHPAARVSGLVAGPNVAARDHRGRDAGTRVLRGITVDTVVSPARHDTVPSPRPDSTRSASFTTNAGKRDSARWDRYRVALRDSGRVLEQTPLDPTGRPAGPAVFRPGPAEQPTPHGADSVLVVINGHEIARGMKNAELAVRRVGAPGIVADSILQVNVIKGPLAQTKYGERGRYGVVEITTRQTIKATP